MFQKKKKDSERQSEESDEKNKSKNDDKMFYEPENNIQVENGVIQNEKVLNQNQNEIKTNKFYIPNIFKQLATINKK